jgi:transposase
MSGKGWNCETPFRVHILPDTANPKLGPVARDVVGVGGRRMLRAVEQGESDPEVLAEPARGRLREKLPALRRALAGRVQPHHRQLNRPPCLHVCGTTTYGK